MIYGELGRYFMDIDIKVRIISYWARLLTGKQSKLSFLIFKCPMSHGTMKYTLKAHVILF
jgi:hypothetical protein